MSYTWEEIQADQEAVAEKFSWLFFYDLHTITPNKWMGVGIQKNPLDLFIYAEIAYEVQPKYIIETGTFNGGSALWWADILKIIHGDDRGRVISIDPAAKITESYRNITFLQGSSLDENIIRQVYNQWDGIGPTIVNLDSLHDMNHVYQEMETYYKLVNPGSYMIVEDGVINGHPTHPEYGPGPYEACEQFLKNHPEFEADRSRERMIITANPLGYLRRK